MFILSLVALGSVVLITVLAYHAQPLLRRYVVETLSARFKSEVELASLDVSVLRGLVVSGRGLKICGQTDLNIHRSGVQPLIGVREFEFRTNVLSLLHPPVHVETVFLRGLELNIPAKNERAQLDVSGQRGKIKIVVDEFRSKDAVLVINTDRKDKLPLEFDIRNLIFRDIGAGQPMRFHAILVNPKPVGDIDSNGQFGPFNAESPRDTPVQGDYSFSNADLGTLKGIGGILSSTGRYEGKLGKLIVDGETYTPDFRLDISGRPVPLKTTFHAIVDGTTGDTHLQPVEATLLNTKFSAAGYVLKSSDPKGHHIHLDVTLAKGRIDDLLRVAVRTEPPVMKGTVRLNTRLDLPAGQADISDRLRLKGNFAVTGAHFSNEKIQGKVDSLSMRSLGRPSAAEDDIPENVQARMRGNFELLNAVLHLPDLHFEIPGTDVQLSGIYSLDGNKFDLYGQLRVDAKLSQMVGGWKSVFLKPVDPFFRKHGATQLPIKIHGTKSDLHFGLDLFHKDQIAEDEKEQKHQK